MPRLLKALLPLAAFILLAALLYKGLSIDPKLVPSPLIDKPAPAFSLPRLDNPEARLTEADFKGQVSLFNVWATWCSACRAEHHDLVDLARRGVRIYSLDYKDERTAALNWLEQLGNPYVATAFDQDGRAAIDWGVYGAPETFVIDKQGIIRHKHIGPLTGDVIEQEIIPMIEKLKAAGG
jgi:cytochrome c biogenesis protein CcmG/thiol:disulfide interchange protein DsbE